jgi:hypothetical protein
MRQSVAAGMNPMDLKRGIDLAVEAVVADLVKKSKKVTSNEEIAQVGVMSANTEIGRYLVGPGRPRKLMMSQRDLNITAIAAVVAWVGFCLYMGWF